MLSSAKLELPQRDREFAVYARGLTELDILCAVVQLLPAADTYYDYFNLTTFRAAGGAGCTSLGGGVLSAAITARNKLTSMCLVYDPPPVPAQPPPRPSLKLTEYHPAQLC